MEQIVVKNGLPNITAIREKLKIGMTELLIKHNFDKIEANYIVELQNAFSNYHVFDFRWKPEILIYPSISTEDILSIASDLWLCAIEFRSEGLQLLKLLGEKNNFNPLEEGKLFEFKKETRKNNQRGRVNEEWNFWFHGAECQFENIKTGQVIELVIWYGTEYGALDSYFFYKYIQTSPKFEKLSKFFGNDSKGVSKALDIIENLGYLKRIDESSSRGRIAKIILNE